MKLILDKSFGWQFLISLAAIAALLIYFFTVGLEQVKAQNNFQNGDNVVLTKDQVINTDYFAAGKNVTVSGTVNGDAYVAGGNIIVEGDIKGDLIAAGGNITVRGNVTNNIRAAGGQIIISGKVGRNASLGGGDIVVTDSGKVNGNMVVGGGNVQILGPLEGNLTGGVGQLTIGNTVLGSVNTGVGQLVLAPSAKVGGDINYWSKEKAQVNPGASVSGALVQNIPQNNPAEQERVRENAQKAAAGFATFFSIISFVSALIVGLLLLRFIPIFSLQVADLIMAKPWLTLGVGILTLIVAPILFIVLLITVVGIPLAFLFLAGFLILTYFAKIFAAIFLGNWISRFDTFKKTSIYLLFIGGLVIYYLVGLIPLLGGLVDFVLSTMAIGAIVIQKKTTWTLLNSKKLI